MRYLLSLLAALLIPLAALHAGDDSSSVSRAFVHPSGKSSVTVLQLRDNGKYDYCRYTNKRIYRDFGVYRIHRGKISFQSKTKKREAIYIGGKTYFINKKGIFKTRSQAVFGKKSLLNYTDDPEYMKTWTYNPLTKKDEALVRKEAEQKAAAAANAKNNVKSLSDYTRLFYINLTSDYANPYKAVLEKGYCGPDCYSTMVGSTPVAWDKDTSYNALFSDAETVMHESVHHYNSTIGKNGNEGYLVEPGVEILVPVHSVFKSCEIKKIIPAGADTKIFRYKTYVSDSSIVSANVSGIYGLLDEFSAYNSGVRYCAISAQNAMMKGDTARAQKFVAQAAGTYFAYYEFNLFMAWYLKTAKADHKDVYDDMMANTNLRVAYTLLDASFKESVESLKRTAAILEKKTGNDQLGVYEKTYEKYPRELLEKEKPGLDAFRIKGVTQSNYFTFLK